MSQDFWSAGAPARVLQPMEVVQQDLAALRRAIARLGQVRLAQHEARFTAFARGGDGAEVLAAWSRANVRLDDGCASVENAAAALEGTLTRLLRLNPAQPD